MSERPNSWRNELVPRGRVHIPQPYRIIVLAVIQSTVTSWRIGRVHVSADNARLAPTPARLQYLAEQLGLDNGKFIRREVGQARIGGQDCLRVTGRHRICRLQDLAQEHRVDHLKLLPCEAGKTA